MDPRLGDFEKADVLIDGSKIAAVGSSLPADGAFSIDASNMIVMPGFVDTHRHIWQGQLRNVLPNGRLDPDYFRDVGTSARNAYRPEDVYVGDLLSAWGAINAGITTLLDWSHISNSPEHSDAAVQGSAMPAFVRSTATAPALRDRAISTPATSGACAGSTSARPTSC